ncbi:hypothetical protein BK136_29980 [Paenibacillus amylolyticus]|nr:hypothetical protein BK136_29980 [Paenibacillus amylolyticus]
MGAHKRAPGRCLIRIPQVGRNRAANEGGTARHKLRPLFCSQPGNGIKDEAFFDFFCRLKGGDGRGRRLVATAQR